MRPRRLFDKTSGLSGYPGSINVGPIYLLVRLYIKYQTVICDS
jgi:hypothetical protein